MKTQNTFSGPKTIEVTFQSQVKVGKALKTFTNVEQHTTEANARLRAMALNWTIVKISPLK